MAYFSWRERSHHVLLLSLSPKQGERRHALTGLPGKYQEVQRGRETNPESQIDRSSWPEPDLEAAQLIDHESEPPW